MLCYNIFIGVISMKRIEAIVRPGKLNELLDELSNNKIFGVTVTQVMGCGKQLGRTQYYRGQKYNVNLLPKTKIEIVAKDQCINEIENIIIKVCRTGEIGDGKIFIYNIEDSLRIRTGDKGENALI
jgi:nitrogen regulatory protein P-II 1